MAKALLTEGGVRHEAKNGFITVGGVYREIKKGFITVNGVYRLAFENALSLFDLPTGAIISTNLYGVPTNFMIVHHGLPSSKYDASCNGVWVLMVGCEDESIAFNGTVNSNDYKISSIHSHLNGETLGAFDPAVQDMIKTVKIPYVNGKGGSAVASGANGLETKLFLLSAHEVGFISASTNYMPAQQIGSPLDYFKDADDSKRIAYYSYNDYVGKATWWLRTPHEDTDAPNLAFIVNQTGGWKTVGVTVKHWIRPAFILPFDAKVEAEPNADGSYTLVV